MSYASVDPLNSKHLPYGFDARFLRSTLRSFQPKCLVIWLCLGVCSVGWLNVEDFLHKRHFSRFEIEHNALQRQINQRLHETENILSIISSFDTGLAAKNERELATTILDLADYY